MKQRLKRITAAWKVLRGEWTAIGPAKPTPIYWTHDTTTSTAGTDVKVTWR